MHGHQVCMATNHKLHQSHFTYKKCGDLASQSITLTSGGSRISEKSGGGGGGGTAP